MACEPSATERALNLRTPGSSAIGWRRAAGSTSAWEEVLSSTLAAGEGCHMFHAYGVN